MWWHHLIFGIPGQPKCFLSSLPFPSSLISSAVPLLARWTGVYLFSDHLVSQLLVSWSLDLRPCSSSTTLRLALKPSASRREVHHWFLCTSSLQRGDDYTTGFPVSGSQMTYGRTCPYKYINLSRFISPSYYHCALMILCLPWILINIHICEDLEVNKTAKEPSRQRWHCHKFRYRSWGEIVQLTGDPQLRGNYTTNYLLPAKSSTMLPPLGLPPHSINPFPCFHCLNLS